jgi:flagellar M-ring protein FliF
VLLVIVFSVLRPLTRGLLTQGRLAAAAAGPAPEVIPAGAAATAGAARVAGGAAQAAAPLAYEQQLAQARTLVGQDPKRVAQVVRSWVSQDES